MQREYGALVAQEELAAYLAGLRQRYKININTAALASRERQ
jgi:peptidyl-prolyl cis-trans isomerase D